MTEYENQFLVIKTLSLRIWSLCKRSAHYATNLSNLFMRKNALETFQRLLRKQNLQEISVIDQRI